MSDAESNLSMYLDLNAFKDQRILLWKYWFWFYDWELCFQGADQVSSGRKKFVVHKTLPTLQSFTAKHCLSNFWNKR